MRNDCRRCGLLSKRISQYCDGCGLYHYYDECWDPYFNDPEVWCECAPRRRKAAAR